MVDTPVWTIPPNWKAGVTERLEWLTDVMSSGTGHEQRRSVRLSPRRSFEFTVNPVGSARSYLDRWMHQIGRQECLLPLWHDKAKLTTDAGGGSINLAFDNTYREFEVGGYAILFFDAFTFEVVEIAGQDGTGVSLVETVKKWWPRGSTIYPLRLCRLDQDSSVTALTSRVGEMSAMFLLSSTNDYPLDAHPTLRPVAYSPSFAFDDVPLITIPPDWQKGIDFTFSRNVLELDSETGRRFLVDEAERAFVAQQYNWQPRGREERHLLRQMFYSLGGRRSVIYLPTFAEDVRVVETANPGTNALRVELAGHTYLGEPTTGRELIWFGGDHVVQVVDTLSTTVEGTERLSLAYALQRQIPDRAVGSYAMPARLDQDAIEFTHHADSNGAAEAAVAFKSFAHPLPEVLPDLPGRDVIDYWFMADRGTFTDQYLSGPSKPGQKVGGWKNYGRRDDAIQPNHAVKPWFRTGGLGGKPYLDCTASGGFFNDLFGMTQTAGIGAAPIPFTCAFVTDDVDTAGGDCYLVGDPQFYWNRSATIRLKSSANEGDGSQVGVKRVDWFKRYIGAAVDFTQAETIIVGAEDVVQFPYLVNDVYAFAGDSANSFGAGLDHVNFLHSDTAPGGGYFVGKLYEFIYWRRLLSEAEMRTVAAYLNSKYGL